MKADCLTADARELVLSLRTMNTSHLGDPAQKYKNTRPGLTSVCQRRETCLKLDLKSQPGPGLSTAGFHVDLDLCGEER